MLPAPFFLDGDWLIVNIALPENAGNILVVERDPRKAEYKPDAYVGVVEKAGPDCTRVAVGDKIVFERWEYSQHNVDAERIVIRQVDVLIAAEEKPMPGIVAVQVLERSVLSDKNIIAPQNMIRKEPPAMVCRVVSEGVDGLVKPGEFFILQKGEKQYRVGEYTVVFRMDANDLDESEILISRLEDPEEAVCG